MNAPHVPEEALWALAAEDPAVSADAAAHVAVCAACRTRVSQLRATRALARRAHLPEPGPGAQARALQRFEAALEQESRRQRTWWDRRPLVLPALGLSALAGAAAALLVGSAAPDAPWPEQPVAPVAAVSAPAVPVARVSAAEPEVSAPVAEAPQLQARPLSRPAARPRVRAASPAPAVAALPAGAAPAVESLPAAEGVEFQQVEQVARFPRVAAAREQLARGQALEAARLASQLLNGTSPEEAAAAAELLHDAAFSAPSPAMFAVLDDAMARTAVYRESLAYLGCEAAVLSRNATAGVRRCRSFAQKFPDSPRARDASYVAGTLARDELHDCQGAVGDYSRALVFTGPLLGSLNDDAQFWRASCYAQLGQRDQARADLEQFLARYPSRRVDPKVRALLEQVGGR